MYKVEYLNEEEESIDFNKWIPVPLEMCRVSRNCGCFDKGEMDSCDFAFNDTNDLQIAKDKKELLEVDGMKARVSHK